MATRNTGETGAAGSGDDVEWRSPVTPNTSPATIDDSADDDADDVASRFAAVMGTTPRDVLRVKLYRVQPRTGKLDWCEDMTPQQIEALDVMDDIREKWGAGEFEFRLIGPRGPMKRVRQSIAALPDSPIAAIQTSPDAGLTQALTMIAQTQNAILQQLAQPKDNGAEFDRMLRFAEVMRGANPASAAPAVDPLAMMGRIFDTLKGAKATMRELNDEAPTEPADPIMAALPKVLDLVTASQRGASEHGAVSLTPPASLTQNRATIAEPVSAEPQPETIEQMMLRGEIEDLIDMAKRDESPEKGGERIAERMPDEFLPYLQNRYWFELVAQIFPVVREHETWLRKAKAHADAILSEPDEDPAP